MEKSNLLQPGQCPVCGRYNNRGVSVDAVILKGKQVLLVKRGSEQLFNGYWATPGGYVEWNETIEGAVRREVKEETGMKVTNIELIKVDSSPERHPKQVINFVYFVNAKGKPALQKDFLDVKWFSLGKLPDTMAFDHKQNILDTILKMKNAKN